MNHFLKIITVSLAFFFSLAGQAQDLSKNPQLQERITQAKLKEIQKALQLDDNKLLALAPIYKRYSAEINQIHLMRPGNILRVNPDSLSIEAADKIITSHLDIAVKTSFIRKTYYFEFKLVLTPQQVMRMYQSEVQMHRRIMQELRRRRASQLR